MINKYFAYGSNMNSRDRETWCRAKDREIVVSNPLVARLGDFKLGFTHYSQKREGGTADSFFNLLSRLNKRNSFFNLSI